MREALIQKLHEYLIAYYSDVLLGFQNELKLNEYLVENLNAIDEYIRSLQVEGKPPYIIEELCLDKLTQQLGPSKFNYVTAVLQEEFDSKYHRLESSGVFVYEITNIIGCCDEVFNAFGFIRDNEEDKKLRYAITGAISEYFENYQ